MRRISLLALLAGAFLLSFAVARTKATAEPSFPSIVQLLANPDRYDGKLVSVVGFLSIEHEGDTLYLHREDYEHALLVNGLWVDTTEAMGRNKSAINLKYVIIVGKFRAGPNGLQDKLVGGITEIQSIRVWSDQEHPQRQAHPEE